MLYICVITVVGFVPFYSCAISVLCFAPNRFSCNKGVGFGNMLELCVIRVLRCVPFHMFVKSRSWVKTERCLRD